MARPQVSNKRENEKNKNQKRLEKQKRKEERKKNSKGGAFEDMIAYVDEFGVISSTPPDQTLKEEINVETIEVSTPKQEEKEVVTYKGRIEHYNTEKGFGFIKDLSSVNKYFFHISEVHGEISEGDIVVFETARGTRGMNAVNVHSEKAQSE